MTSRYTTTHSTQQFSNGQFLFFVVVYFFPFLELICLSSLFFEPVPFPLQLFKKHHTKSSLPFLLLIRIANPNVSEFVVVDGDVCQVEISYSFFYYYFFFFRKKHFLIKEILFPSSSFAHELRTL